ncbi:hypothetical protein [Cysteiniphilum halobium]|uniref:hypothetical protein n=1 Tax=Cysteiniphilum halobium TaxID=2219059 RepID=UPI000E658D64|nr:hypothetical protein [Cysteiniphilum halobium]
MMFKISFVVVLAFLISGCTTFSIDTTNGKNANLVFGYIDMSDTGQALNRVMIVQEGGSHLESQSEMNVYTDGLFYMDNVAPGKFYIPSFEGQVWLFDPTGYEFQKPKDAFTLHGGDLFYVGTYKVKISTGEKVEKLFLGLADASIIPIKQPSMQTLLKWLKKDISNPYLKKKIDEVLKSDATGH